MRTSITELPIMLEGEGYVIRRTIWGGTEYVVFSPEQKFEKVVLIVERNIAAEQKR